MTQSEHLEALWPTGSSPVPGRPGDRLPASRQSGGDDRHDRGTEPWSDRDGPAAPGSAGPSGAGSGPSGAAGFERVPPQDLEAEQSVLGGMLLSKDAIADVVEVLKGQDFYRPAHETVYQAILDLYAKGEPADPITVAAELTRRGEISRVGGPGYLHSLVQMVPTAANAEYYAEIVHERAVLRRLVTAGTRITQMGYAADGDVDEIVNSAQAEIYAVTEQRTSEDYLPLSEIMEGALDEIEAIGSRSGQMSGVPTGFTDLDSLTNGLHPGQMVVIAARPAMGKALALDTPLPTPTGWTTMGEVRPGDLLLDGQGRPTRVVAATDVLVDRPCFEVTFDDGTVIVADADHQWLTETRASRRAAGVYGPGDRRARPSVRTTKEIAATLRCTARSDQRLNHSVVTAAPLDLPARELPVPPYSLGQWLGSRQLGSGRPDDGFGGAGERPAAGAGRAADLPEWAAALPEWVERGAPGIPRPYLRGSVEQRRALLAGLLDAGGTVTGAGAVRFTTRCRAVAEGVRELVVSLGHRCRMTVTPGRGQGRTQGQDRSEDQPRDRRNGRTADASPRYTVAFRTGDEVFGGERERRRHAERRRPGARRQERRFVTDVREVESVPVRCVQVDHPDGLYLATHSMVPTHNSTLALDFARACSIRSNLPSVIFSLEMGRNEIAMRLLSAEARVALHHMRSGSMTDEDWTRLARRMPEVTEAPLYIDDSPNLSMMEIRAKCRRLKQRNDLQLVVIDYLQLMQTGGSRRPESRQQEVSEMSRNLKLLAKELEVPVIALSQLNRGPEQRTDKKPMVSDLRESGCLTADTTLLRADTGAPVTFAELRERGHEGVLVWSLDEHRRLVPAPVTNVFSSGTKRVHRLQLASGREVKATGNHRFRTPDGWTPLDELAVGSAVAVPRHVPKPVGAGLGWSPRRLGLLAHLLGAGSVPPDAPVGYASDDEANLTFVESAAAAEFGVVPRRVRRGARWHSHLPAPGADGERDPLRGWLRELGVEDPGPDRTRLPDAVYSADDDEAAVFLRHLWATNGSVRAAEPGDRGAARCAYPTPSRALADGVAVLLSRFGIVARVTGPAGAGRGGDHQVVVEGAGVRTFCREIGGYGRRAEQVAHLLAHLDDHVTAAEAGSSAGAPQGTADTDGDILWDRVVALEPLGEQPVFDATVKGTHNFVADGLVAHNSIEQDADMVILLHREDAYEKESPRAGEADLIVAKHRNGPTATITVAFQGHYSRFVDMAGNA